MLDRLPSFTGNPAPAAALVAWALALGACSAPPTVPEIQFEAVTDLRDLLEGELRAEPMPVPRSAEDWEAMAEYRVVVCLAEDPSLPVAPLDTEGRLRMQSWIRRGARLVLLGYAGRLVYELGIEDLPPDRYGPERWGFDSRTRLGEYRYGFRCVSGRVPELIEGLQPEPRDTRRGARAHTYLFGGGEGVDTQVCLWSGYAPAQGEVLGRLAGVRDGDVEEHDAVAVARWRYGRGQVLVLGHVPEPDRPDPRVAANARRILGNALRLVSGGTAGTPASEHPVAVWLLPAEPPPRPAAPLPTSDAVRADLPGAPLLAHWGFQIDLQGLAAGGSAPTPDQVLRQMMLPAWRSGADLFELRVGDAEGDYPLEWNAADPLRRPEGYGSDVPWFGWNAQSLRDLAVEAHARGVLLHCRLDPGPVPGGDPVRRLAALRFLARELCDLRGLDDGAWDGLGLHDWFPDGEGSSTHLLQDFHPGASLFSTDTTVPAPAAALSAVHADDGQPLDVPAAGVSEVWRAGFDAVRHPLAMLDCRTRPRGDADAGGSYGDWVVTQAHDFVRQRLGRGPAAWWRALDPAAVDPETLVYALGVAMDPLRCAVAARLWSTGRDGYRAQVAGRSRDVQRGFGAESELPASSPFLQNNHLRLFGSGGTLLWDPKGLARFRDGQAVVLARELVTTRLQGARPRSDGLRSGEIDLRGIRPRTAGGYEAAVTVDRLADDGGFPEALALDRAGRWPRRATVRYAPDTGMFELRLTLRGIEGAGLVELRDDGELLHLLPFRAGLPAVDHVLPWHVAREGERTLALEVVRGGVVAIDVLRLARRSDLAAEVRLGDRAGHRASLEEWTTSSYHADRSEWIAIGDLPGFLWRTEYRRADRNLQVRRRIGLLRHRELAWHSPGDTPRSLRGPFVLRAPGGGAPDLAVVPLSLSRYERFELRNGELEMVSQPAPLTGAEVGFLLLEAFPGRGRPDPEVAARLPELFEAVARPPSLDLDGTGPAEVHGELPFPWTRVVRLRNAARTPYLVRENGWWTFRGGQPATDGSDWLRLWQFPGEPTRVLTGNVMLRATRPGPGSLHTVALRDVEPGAVTVRVLQPDPMAFAPSVTMAGGFGSVLLDGEPWSYHNGREVFLPARPGTYRVETDSTGSPAAPRLLATRAVVERCAWDPARRELVIATRDADGRPVDLPYTALISGPEPTAIEGGERIPEGRFPYANAARAAAAGRAGVLVRFRPGLLRLRYAPDGS